MIINAWKAFTLKMMNERFVIARYKLFRDRVNMRRVFFVWKTASIIK